MLPDLNCFLMSFDLSSLFLFLKDSFLFISLDLSSEFLSLESGLLLLLLSNVLEFLLSELLFLHKCGLS